MSILMNLALSIGLLFICGVCISFIMMLTGCIISLFCDRRDKK
jgi:hypothetical protein